MLSAKMSSVVGRGVPFEQKRSEDGPIGLVWHAGFETGDGSELVSPLDGSPVDLSGGATAEMETSVVHHGDYSIALSVDSTSTAGARVFRKYECWQDLQPYYYGCWFYFPEFHVSQTHWNIWQYKTKDEGGDTDVAWKLEARSFGNNQLGLALVWAHGEVGGPFSGDPIQSVPFIQPATKPIILGKWIFLEVYLKQSSSYDGQIIVWQDGEEIYNIENIKTKDTNNNWSVNNYATSLDPAESTIYIDDMMVSTGRIGAAANDTISSYSVQPAAASAKDTLILSGQANNNFNAVGALAIGESSAESNNVYRTLIQFDLSGIPEGAIIEKAIVGLYAYADNSSNARTVRAYRLKRSWVETEATWNSASTGVSWQTPGGFGSNDCEQTDIGSLQMSASASLNTMYIWDLDPEAVQEWVDGTFANNGLLFKADTENNDQFGYRDCTASTAANRPIMSVIYRLRP